MTDCVSKGVRAERRAVDWLRCNRYMVHRCVRTIGKLGQGGFASQSNDIFGVIDLIAKKRGERTRWIQVTCDRGIGRKRRDLETVPWVPQHDCVEVWRWVGSKHGRIDRRTGKRLEDLYFQVYRLDEAFRYDPGNRIGPYSKPVSWGGRDG